MNDDEFWQRVERNELEAQIRYSDLRSKRIERLVDWVTAISALTLTTLLLLRVWR